MSRLEIKVDGDDVGAQKMLKAALLTLGILKSIERQICKEQGSKPSIRWRVDIQSGFSYGLIALRAEPPADGTTPRYTETVAAFVDRFTRRNP